MQNVITYSQAKKITKGRTPLVPVVYEEAVKALSECIDLDDAKIWSDKFDALAAWAKIYHDDKVARQAKQLKLHAFRRMGEIAREITGDQTKRSSEFKRDQLGRIISRPTGFKSLLRKEAGLNINQASAAAALSRMSEEKFDEAINSPRVPSLSALKLSQFKEDPELVGLKSALHGARSSLRRNDLADVARKIPFEGVSIVLNLVKDVIELLDEFELHLGKRL